MSVDKFGRCGGLVERSQPTFSAAGLVHKAGDTMTGDLRLSTGADTIRLLGRTDLAAGQGFSLSLGNIQNQLQFIVSPQKQPPVTLETSHGFIVRASGSDVMHVGRTHISMNSRRVSDLSDPSEQQDAATKAYVDRPRCDIFTGHATDTENGSILSLRAARALLYSSLDNGKDVVSIDDAFWRLTLLVACNVRLELRFVMISQQTEERDVYRTTVDKGQSNISRLISVLLGNRFRIRVRKVASNVSLKLNTILLVEKL